MQSKGAIRFVAILLLLASLWQLSFTLVTNRQEKKAEKYAEAKAVAAMNSAAFGKVAEADKAFYLDSIRKDESRRYIDSISSEKIYLGYTYKEVQAKSINLGLDLKGGMNVMLQVQLKDLVRALGGNNAAPEFAQALNLAQERSVNSRQAFITLFAEAWQATSNGMPLAQIFGTFELRDKIGPESTDEQVSRLSALRLKVQYQTHSTSSETVSTVSVCLSQTSRSLETADVSSSSSRV